MNIPKAIKYMTFALASFPEGTDPLYIESYKLGIEALKRVKLEHERDGVKVKWLLPGETKE